MANGDLISRASLLAGIAELKESPWHNFGKVDGTSPDRVEAIWHYGYLQRKEAVEIIEDMCIKKEPAVLADDGWISVDDAKPDVDCTVLAYHKYEGITREQYHEAIEKFIDEFVDNGANEATVANCILIGLAFGKLELMLFGENEDGE